MSGDDVGLSDHFLLSWLVKLAQPPPTYITSTRRNSKDFDYDAFVHQLAQTELCLISQTAVDVDANRLAERYSVIITSLLDQLAPVKTVTVKQCNRRPWFDEETRTSSCDTRRLERRHKKDKTPEALAIWRASLKMHRKLTNAKASAYWRSEINYAAGNPRRLWRNMN